MSKLTELAGEVSSELLSEFGNPVEVQNDAGEVLLSTFCTLHRQLLEPQELGQIQREVILLRFAMSDADSLVAGYVVDFGASQYSLTRRAKGQSVGLSSVLDDHWVIWFGKAL